MVRMMRGRRLRSPGGATRWSRARELLGHKANRTRLDPGALLPRHALRPALGRCDFPLHWFRLQVKLTSRMGMRTQRKSRLASAVGLGPQDRDGFGKIAL